MIVELVAYLVWILLTIGAVAIIFRLLRFDQPRKVVMPVKHDDQS
jgi:hypothetical protein